MAGEGAVGVDWWATEAKTRIAWEDGRPAGNYPMVQIKYFENPDLWKRTD
jgi:hypothetical protein